MGKARRCRWLVLVGASLVLGAATSVGVAWAVVWFGPRPTIDVGWGKRRATECEHDPFPLKWYVFVKRGFGVTEKSFVVDTGRELSADEERRFVELASDGPSAAAARRHAFLLDGKDDDLVQFAVMSWGWPIRCLAAERAFSPADSKSKRSMLLDTNPFAPSTAYSGDPRNTLSRWYTAWEVRGRALPLGPLWDGLAVCTATYGAAWLVLLWPVAGFVRRRLRRAGCCAGCGYSLAGLATGVPCPECGRGVG